MFEKLTASLNNPFLNNPTKFSASKIPDQTGKTVIVTGGNTGIGFQTCLELARNGAHVYLAARSEQKAGQAIIDIKSEIPTAKITFLKLDLQDLKQVQTAAQEFASKETVLDTLINNAGIMACPFALTKDGIETQFGTNHVGHYLFTTELIPKLLNSSEPRIVILSSSAQVFAPKQGVMFERINDPKAMDTTQRYGQSKLSNLLFVRELNKRYGDKIYVNAVHPGVVQTQLTRSVKDTLGVFYYPLFPVVKAWEASKMSPAQGALTSLYVATSGDIVENKIKGKYYVPYAVQAETIPHGKSDEMAEKLWSFTEELVNEKLGKFIVAPTVQVAGAVVGLDETVAVENPKRVPEFVEEPIIDEKEGSSKDVGVDDVQAVVTKEDSLADQVAEQVSAKVEAAVTKVEGEVAKQFSAKVEVAVTEEESPGQVSAKVEAAVELETIKEV